MVLRHITPVERVETVILPLDTLLAAPAANVLKF